MDLSKFERHYVNKLLCKGGARSKYTHRCSANVRGDVVPSCSPVAKLVADFKNGLKLIEDPPKSGCLADGTDPQTVAQVEHRSAQ